MENIGGDSADKSYRYQMPRIATKVEGKGNGIRTVFPNILEIGTALRRDPAYITKYFGYELGALSQYTEKTHQGVVNGNHSWNTIHDLLKNFIRTFLLCHHCGNPETDFGLGGGNLTMHCLACGGVSQAPAGHRLTGAIIKEVQQAKKAAKKGGRERDRGERGAEREHEEHHEPAKPASRRPKREEQGGGDDGDWSTDVSQEAVEARRLQAIAALSDRAAAALLGGTKPAEGSPAPPATATATVPTPAPVAAPAPPPPSLPSLPPPPNPFDGTLARIFEAGIDEAKIKRNAAILKPMAATQMSQLQLLIALQRFIHERHLSAQAPALFKHCYDEDLLPEEVLLTWADRPEALTPLGADPAVERALRPVVSPLFQWLKTAEEDDDDDEDGEDEEEDEVKPASAKPGAAKPAAKTKEEAFIDDL